MMTSGKSASLSLARAMRSVSAPRSHALSQNVIRCALNTDSGIIKAANGGLCRRQILGLGVSGLTLTGFSPDASAKFEKYIKRKDLDPLETYVPPLIAAKEQLQQAAGLLDSAGAAEPARKMLREGPFSGLRDNVRTVGLYAEKAGISDSKERIDAIFSALQAYDTALLQAVRSDAEELPSGIREKAEAVAKALDRLLDTVPEDTLARSQAIINKVNGVGNIETADVSTPSSTSSAADETKNLDLLF